ncbi:fem1 protein, partial [Trichoderma arundinaceum]
MKYSVAAVTAFVAAALAKPQFLNSAFQVQEGKPFTLKYSGCDSGCTIVLQTGASSNLK